MASSQSDPAAAAGYPKQLSARIGFLLAQAHIRAREESDKSLSPLGLSAKAYGALATVMSDGPISQQQLGKRIAVDPATMVDVIDSLEESGYILRERNTEDRRQYALQATPKGRALYKRALRALIAAEKRTIRNLDSKEATVLADLLSRIAGPT